MKARCDVLIDERAVVVGHGAACVEMRHWRSFEGNESSDYMVESYWDQLGLPAIQDWSQQCYDNVTDATKAAVAKLEELAAKHGGSDD